MNRTSINRVLVWAAVIAGLAALKSMSLAAMAGASVILLAISFFTDKRILGRIGKPRFWLLLLFVSALGGLTLGERDYTLASIPISSQGLQAGVVMSLRAFILTLGLALVSRGFSSSRFAGWIKKLRLGPLTSALEVAGGALPSVISDSRRFLTKKGSAGRGTSAEMIAAVCADSDGWGDDALIEKEPPTAAHLFFVTSDRQTGKTTLLDNLARRLEQAGHPIDGVLQPAVYDQGLRIGYDLLMVSSKQRKAFARKKPTGYGYQFSLKGFLAARDAISQCRRGAIHFVDELGLLEAKNGGHLPSTRRAIAMAGGVWLLAVRKEKLSQIKELLPDVGTTEIVLAASDEVGPRAEQLYQRITEVKEDHNYEDSNESHQ